jgi:hypothetical protein
LVDNKEENKNDHSVKIVKKKVLNVFGIDENLFNELVDKSNTKNLSSNHKSCVDEFIRITEFTKYFEISETHIPDPLKITTILGKYADNLKKTTTLKSN